MLTTHVVPKNITISGTQIRTFPPDVQNTLLRAGIKEWEYAYEQMAPGGGAKKIFIVLKAGFVPTEQQWNILINPQKGNFNNSLFKTARYPGSLIMEGFSRAQTGPVAPGAVTPAIAPKYAYTDSPRPSKPVVITPYDAIVSKAVNELGSLLKGVDIIKLETTSAGDRAGWVSNSDLIKGIPGKERVIHLCLNKIKDHFKKHFGQAFSISDPSQQQKMKEIVKEYLKVVLQHETEHINQELEHGGDFGPNPEMGAEKAEDWSKLKDLGIMKKEAAQIIVAKLDELADKLQASNLIKEATELDLISNTLESKVAFDIKGLLSKIPGVSKIPSAEEAMKFILDQVKKVGSEKVVAALKDIGQNMNSMVAESGTDKQAAKQQSLIAKYGTWLVVAAVILAAAGKLQSTVNHLEQKVGQHAQSVMNQNIQTHNQEIADLQGQA